MAADVQLLDELQACGTEQNRKVYRQHGVSGEMFGVSYGDLGKLKKKVRVDHAAALALWATGNHDARVFATMIADAKQADDALLDAWASDLSNYVITDAFSGFASRTPLARRKMEQWTQSPDEWIATAGWNMLTHLAMNDSTLGDDYFEKYLAIIEHDLHNSKNRVRYAMNNALIAIGTRSETLEAKALAAAARIGKVIVDHGQTNCKTPDAVSYIKKARARKSS